MMERWADIQGYEGVYQVSDLGNVKSLARSWVWGKGALRMQPDRILSPGVNSSGYMTVNLVVDGVSKNRTVHRLVADAFIPNPEGKAEINHLNGNKKDNRAINLARATREENQRHAYDTGLHKKTRINCAESCKRRFSKTVQQLTKDGLLVNTFPSENEAWRATGVFQANINKCINGAAHSAGGFIWKRA